jgi:hypothetical protein
MVRFSRHAENRARDLRVTVADAEGVINRPVSTDLDADGKFLYIGYIGSLSVRVVVALDEPDLIVTIHERR